MCKAWTGFLFFISIGFVAYAQGSDSLYLSIVSARESVETVDQLIKAADSLILTYENEPIEYATKALSISRKLGHRKGMGMAYRCMGSVYRIYRGEVNQSKQYYDSAIEILKNSNDVSEYGKALRGLASSRHGRESFRSSNVRQLYYDAIKILEKGNALDRAIAKEQSAFLIIGDGEFERGQNTLDSLIVIYSQRKQLLRELFLLDVSTAFYIERDSAKAKRINRTVFELSQKYNLKGYLCLAYMRAGEISLSHHSYQEALQNFTSAEHFSKIALSKKFSLYRDLALCYGHLDRKRNVKIYLKKGADLSRQFKMHENIADFFWLLSSFYEKERQFDSALVYQKEYGQIIDSIATENARHLDDLENQYQAKQRLIENMSLKKDIRMQTLLSISGGVVALILAGLVVMVVKSRKQIKIKSLILAEANEDLTTKNTEILAQNEEITAQQEQINTAYENARSLNEIGKVITGCLSVEDIAEAAYQQISKLLDISIFGVGVVNESANRIEFPRTIKQGASLAVFTRSLDDQSNMWVSCILNKRSVLVDNLTHDYHEPFDIDQKNQVHSFICVPMMQKGIAIGLLYVQTNRAGAFTQYHLNLLQNIGLYAQVALENAMNHKLIIEKNEILSRHNSVKDKLFSVVAHDIRGPMNSLRGLLQLINSRSVSEKDRNELLLRIDENFKYTQQLVDNVLHWANAQISGIEVIRGKFDLQYICNQTINVLQEAIRKKEVIVLNKIPSVLAFGDENMIQLVLRNLISNSIKFVPRGGIIDITCVEAESFVTVCVTDNGIGISTEHQKQLFQMESRHSSYGTEMEKGTGLGLSLCKDFVEKNGGKIWVASELKNGSRFYFTIPKKYAVSGPTLSGAS